MRCLVGVWLVGGVMRCLCVCVCVCVSLCVCKRERQHILYDFGLHESVATMFKQITLTHTVGQKDDTGEWQEM